MGHGVVQLAGQRLSLLESDLLERLVADDAAVADGEAQGGREQQHDDAADKVGETGEVGGRDHHHLHYHDHQANSCLPGASPPEQRVHQNQDESAGDQDERLAKSEDRAQVQHHERAERQGYRRKGVSAAPQHRQRQGEPERERQRSPYHAVADEHLDQRGTCHRRSEDPVAPHPNRWFLGLGLHPEPPQRCAHEPQGTESGRYGGSTERAVPRCLFGQVETGPAPGVPRRQRKHTGSCKRHRGRVPGETATTRQ